MTTVPVAEKREFRWYLGGVAAWFTSFGIQTIVFPWLPPAVPHDPRPRSPPRGARAPRALAGIVSAGALGYPALLGYGIAMGTLGAFVVPARDALLTRVVRRGRERAIAVTSAGQFICQLAGIVVGGVGGRG